MKKPHKAAPETEMLDEYDFGGGLRGKYAQAYSEGTNIVVLEPDVAEVFRDSQSVNEALRVLAALVRAQSRKSSSDRAKAGE